MNKSSKREAKHEPIDWRAVGRRIRELRGFDLTQEEFARRVGVSQSYLSTMERGEVEIGAEILLRISREFGKSLEWLLTGKREADKR
jgi:transcriptional regulator with XRE-family HTH domain